MKNFLPAKYSIIGSYYRNNASTTALLVIELKLTLNKQDQSIVLKFSINRC